MLSPQRTPESSSESDHHAHTGASSPNELVPQTKEPPMANPAHERLPTDAAGEEHVEDETVERTEAQAHALETRSHHALETGNHHALLNTNSQTSAARKSQAAELSGLGQADGSPSINPSLIFPLYGAPAIVQEDAGTVSAASAEFPHRGDLIEFSRSHKMSDLTEDDIHHVSSLAPTKQAAKAVLETPLPSVESDAIPEKSQKDHMKLELASNDTQTDRVKIDRIPEDPLIGCTVSDEVIASSQTESMELNTTSKDQFALPHLEDNDMTWEFDAQGRAEETEDMMAMIQASSNTYRKSLPLNSSSGLVGAPSTEDADMIDIAAFDSDEENAAAAKRFEEVKEYYEARRRTGKFNEVDDIDYERALRAEQERVRRQRENDAYHAPPEPDEELMFVPQDDGSPQSHMDSSEARHLPGHAAERDLDAIEHSQSLTTNSSSKKVRPKSSCTPSRAGVIKGKVTKHGDIRKRGQKPSTMDFDSLARNSNDLISVAQANQNKGKQPTFTSTTKSQALKELILSMPEDQRRLNNIDRKEIEAASKKFTGRGVVKADGHGGWRLKGMKSSLHHYQLLGAAFMRERERDRITPGGFLADQMGLGKTVLAIANIIDGQVANAKRKDKATLVIAPSSLLSQWMAEIDKHAEPERIKKVLLYRSESQYKVRDPVAQLGQHDVVITSYNEVCRSWPKNSPPLELSTEEGRADWWAKERRENLGLLHLVQWDRLLLDEAQAIKNHLSRTSEAVCQLKGTHRWVVSGTPIQNKLEEFYPFFRFIGIPETGSYQAFKKNFCKRSSELALKRLQEMLSRYMLRRTHSDQLLGAPILTLPNIKSTTIALTFSHIEKAIYNIIKERFVINVRTWSQAGSAERKYQTIFVLLLRLRQVTAHCLLIQDTLKKLLNESDLQRLWKLTEDDCSFEDHRLIRGLKQQLINTVPDGSQTPQDSGVVGPITSRFRRYLQSMRDDGAWKEIAERTLCALCKCPPVNPYITACSHIYCQSCLEDLKWNANSEKTKGGPRCVACAVRFDHEERCHRDYLQSPDRGSPVSVQAGRKKGSLDPEETNTDWLNIGGPIMQSAKTKAAVSQIDQWLKEDEAKERKSSKIILFTQFRAMIDIMERICRERRWECARFHGGMSFDAKDKAVKRFQQDDECLILLAGLKAGGVGLNLTAGNRVIIIDLWWNQFVETQAFCRVYRIGQEREVEVVRFVVEDTIDEDIAAMQERKNLEIDQAIEAQYRPEKPSTKEMMALFNIDLERDGSGEPIAGLHEEPFIFTKDPYQRKGRLDDLSA